MAMFTHVRVGCNDPVASIAFYDALFGALGVSGQYHGDQHAMYGSHETGLFMVGPPADGQAATPANGGTIGLQARDRAAVDAWYAGGMAKGGSDEGPPGERNYTDPPIYGAYLRDPDGNKLCAFCPPGV
jgi:catechol 2,3-dioxygenase-like lactoylglutathione lyase family enzyme